jgi:hypothetical protein
VPKQKDLASHHHRRSQNNAFAKFIRGENTEIRECDRKIGKWRAFLIKIALRMLTISLSHYLSIFLSLSFPNQIFLKCLT